jgi:dGTPase
MIDSICRELEEREKRFLHPRAAFSSESSRQKEEEPPQIRTAFQRDRDRILHSKSFRRLKRKTQVFISPQGDHYRTRLTHTLEVSQIARTIAKSLNLNEDLTEAIALGHDLGHTPFGHMGEEILDTIAPAGFRHYVQSLRVVDKLEYNGKGLNLTNEVRDGIVKHSKGEGPILPADRAQLARTLEGQVVRISDLIAYVNHDIDDALRAGLLSIDQLPKLSLKKLGRSFARRIDTLVKDVIQTTLHSNYDSIHMSSGIYLELTRLREFLFDRIYRREKTREDREKIDRVLRAIYQHLMTRSQDLIPPYPQADPLSVRAIDFIAGMSDNYAVSFARDIFFPRHLF